MLDDQPVVRKDGKRHNKFVRFLLKSWQPIPTWQSTIALFFVIGLILIGFGVALVIINSNIIEASARYDEDCYDSATFTLKSPCIVTVTVASTMTQPVFVYYEIDNFYQNHRRYINSQSSTQLAGKTVSDATASSDCSPIVTNADMGKTTAVDGTALVSTAVALPCGLVAKSFFTDTYTLTFGSTTIGIQESGIAWPSDVGTKFKNTDLSKQWHNITDEHFIVWMRTAGLPDFRKLWGKINQDLVPGEYKFSVVNTYNVSGFEGKKRVVLSTTGPFGGKNNFLAIAYLVVGGICVLVSLFFLIRWRQYSKKNQ
jgi:hypothetical protein